MGGKSIIRDIVALLFPPEADRYAEHFFGGGSMLFSTPPIPGRMEVVNDFDSNLVNFYLCVRDRIFALLEALKLLPLQTEYEFNLLKKFLAGEEILPDFSPNELQIARRWLTQEQYQEIEPILKGRAQPWDIQRAVAFYKVNRFCFNGTMDAYAVKPARLYRFLATILAASQRLKDVVITNRDFEASIKAIDNVDTLHYCDPPYFKTEKMYSPEFSVKDHCRLHDTLRNCKGPQVISYNDCDFTRKLYDDFYIMHFERQNCMSQTEGAVYEELLITSYDPRPMLAQNTEQFNMFEPDMENGKLILVHEPAQSITVAMPSNHGGE